MSQPEEQRRECSTPDYMSQPVHGLQRNNNGHVSGVIVGTHGSNGNVVRAGLDNHGNRMNIRITSVDKNGRWVPGHTTQTGRSHASVKWEDIQLDEQFRGWSREQFKRKLLRDKNLRVRKEIFDSDNDSDSYSDSYSEE